MRSPSKAGTDRHRDRDIRHLDLQAANFDRLLHDLVVRNPGHHVLVGADARGQDFRDIAVGDDREAIVDRPGGRGVPLVGHLAQGHDEGEDSVLVVEQVAAEVAGLDAAEAQGRPAGETERVDGRRDLGAEGHQTRLPAQLHAAFHELLGETRAVVVGAHEDVEAPLLELTGDGHGRLDIRGGADDSRKARGRAVDELNSALAQNDIVRGTEPEILHRVRPDQVFARLDDLFGEQGGHARVEGRTEIGRPEVLIDLRRQQAANLFHHPFEIGQGLDGSAGHRVDDRQIVARIRKLDLRVLALLLDRPIQDVLGLLRNLVCAADRRGGNELRHSPNLSLHGMGILPMCRRAILALRIHHQSTGRMPVPLTTPRPVPGGRPCRTVCAPWSY